MPDSDEERLASYEVLKKIGSGRFGEVFLVKQINSEQLYCWKVIKYKELRDKEKNQLVMEVNVMRELKHRNIVRYIDRMIDKKRQLLYILMEYCNGGDLAQNMKRFRKYYESVNENVIFDIARQLLMALDYCHNLKSDGGVSRILHRDLKPQNIFLSTVSPDNNNYICKIGDFGLSRNLGPESFAHSCVGTPYYWSPELLLSDTKEYDDRVDIWALGCVLYEFSCGYTPFHEATTLSELAQKVKEGAPLPIPGRSKELNCLLHLLLRQSPSERPSARQCLGLNIIDNPPIFNSQNYSIMCKNKPEDGEEEIKIEPRRNSKNTQDFRRHSLRIVSMDKTPFEEICQARRDMKQSGQTGGYTPRIDNIKQLKKMVVMSDAFTHLVSERKRHSA